MKFRKHIILLIAIFFVIGANAQRISRVLATVKDDKVLIGYQLKGLRCEQKVEGVNFYVSRDGGDEFTGPLEFVSGDVEPGLRNGKHIVEWDALKEMPFTDEVMVFDVQLDIKEKNF